MPDGLQNAIDDFVKVLQKNSSQKPLYHIWRRCGTSKPCIDYVDEHGLCMRHCMDVLEKKRERTKLQKLCRDVAERKRTKYSRRINYSSNGNLFRK